MAQVRVRARGKVAEAPAMDSELNAQPVKVVPRAQPVKVRTKKKVRLADRAPSPAQTAPPRSSNRGVKRAVVQGAHEKEVRERLQTHEDDRRFQHELEEMQEVHDLDEIDDDVEAEATILEWYALEHVHRPKSARWFAGLAAGTTLVVGIQLFLMNFIGALTLALVGAMVYYIAQQEPEKKRYRVMVDGVAVGNLLYHWKDLATFNVIYEPGECKTVILRSQRLFSHHIHLEIDDQDPVEIRDTLLEFLPEDQDMEEPISDVLARRLGF